MERIEGFIFVCPYCKHEWKEDCLGLDSGVLIDCPSCNGQIEILSIDFIPVYWIEKYEPEKIENPCKLKRRWVPCASRHCLHKANGGTYENCPHKEVTT